MTTNSNPNAGKHIVVIGAGPGGYAAAFHAAELGFKVTLVNAENRLGGVCLNRGCIPSKAFLHIAKLINEAEESKAQGITFVPPEINVDKLRGWKDSVLAKLSGGVAELARLRKVTVIAARATFKDSHTLNLAACEGCPPPPAATLSFDYAIVATGSTPVMPGPFKLGDPRVMDSTGALELADIPKKLLVIGGGYIGLEMGTAYAALGSKVTVVELLDGLLMGADRDLVKPLQKRLEKKFAAILLGTKVESLKATPKGIVVKLSGGSVGTEGGAAAEQTFDRVLVSVGRRPNGQGLGLE
ncbi:MAG TPA: NAD(P)/FAD-dependent oxidoreductase, partial [Planctomycetota bacterium]|nr:NAD(P)/FAD-dependent oxidoreductase [Planctomycetota bacterium]